MALKTANFTMDGTVQSLSPTTHTPIKWIRIENPSGNATVTVSDKNGTAAIYGFSVTAGLTNAESKEIGPFGGGECPFNLGDIFVRGTNAQIIHLTYVTL